MTLTVGGALQLRSYFFFFFFEKGGGRKWSCDVCGSFDAAMFDIDRALTVPSPCGKTSPRQRRIVGERQKRKKAEFHPSLQI